MDYMYSGEVSVDKDDLEAFLKLAGDLKVEGLLMDQQQSNPKATTSNNNIVNTKKRPKEIPIAKDKKKAKKDIEPQQEIVVKEEELEESEWMMGDEEDALEGILPDNLQEESPQNDGEGNSKNGDNDNKTDHPVVPEALIKGKKHSFTFILQ